MTAWLGTTLLAVTALVLAAPATSAAAELGSRATPGFAPVGGASPQVQRDSTALFRGQDGRQWLAQMRSAMADLSYEGIFTYQHGDDLSSLRVVHGFVDGVPHERLVHLNGVPREILRIGDDVACLLMPGDAMLELDGSIPSGPFAGSFTSQFESLPAQYRVVLGSLDRVAGRAALELRITPVDSNRFGYRLWLDVDSGLLLRSELLGETGERLEIFQFASVQVVSQLPAELLQGEHREGQVVHHLTLDKQQTLPPSAGAGWATDWLPEGFVMASWDIRRTTNSLQGLNTLMYTDGLAAFSVFIEEMPEFGAAMASQNNVQGATVAVARKVVAPGKRPHMVTLVGELPLATARRIVDSVRPVPGN